MKEKEILLHAHKKRYLDKSGYVKLTSYLLEEILELQPEIDAALRTGKPKRNRGEPQCPKHNMDFGACGCEPTQKSKIK